MKRFKDDVNEVRAGTECGIGVKNYNDVQEGDQIECYSRVEVARTLASPPVSSMAKDNPRARRLGEQIQRELGELLRRDVKDERIGNVTITAVDVTGDLRTARVYYLVFGKDGPDPKVQRGLESAAGFLRNALSRVADDPLHADIEFRTRHLDRTRCAPDPVDRLGQQAGERCRGRDALRGIARGWPRDRRGLSAMPADIHGILLLDKPVGLSSAGAVARVKRLFNARKAGHTGSLDPLASGLLPICFGEATKFGAQLLDADKTYRVTVRLGERTPSADRESEVIERRELPAYSLQQLEQALSSFPREYAAGAAHAFGAQAGRQAAV